MKKYLFLSAISLFVALPVSAALVPSCATQTGGPTCTVCDVVSAAITAANIMATSLSGIVLLMFVLGGFYMIISHGNEELVTKGRKILTGAVIGIIFVLFAWLIVNTVLRVLVKGSLTESGDVQILSGTWWSPACTIAKVTDCDAKDSSGNYPIVGSACSACTDNQATGSENCYCRKNTATNESENNICDDNQCECVSLCSVWARDYASHAGYQCYSISATSGLTCLTDDVCPRASDGEILSKCCK